MAALPRNNLTRLGTLWRLQPVQAVHLLSTSG